ncbi:MAG: hypothetical protein A2992_10350 [Elusimicrobia bacterium RIFCSPLOWO2_01_FULL_59_12]|nr:MAG: hypothetical protein A2992_10350 [Elusimicrobia bacterium RIFCSPLOWO2_01_FULL_59_12]
MQMITIADRLWLEPTLLGVTLNFSDRPNDRHYRVGIGFRSLTECDNALCQERVEWMMKDKSLLIQGSRDLTLTFCPGTRMEQTLVLTGEARETFRGAISFLGLASESRNN